MSVFDYVYCIRCKLFVLIVVNIVGVLVCSVGAGAGVVVTYGIYVWEFCNLLSGV